MSNNTLISLGIIGILSTGSVAVVANTQSLVQQDSSALLDASNVLLNQEVSSGPDGGLSVPTLDSPTPVSEALPADSATPQDSQVVSPTPTVQPQPVVTTPAPAPVDGTSSGSYYSDDEDDDDDDDDDDGHDDDDDDDHDGDDD